MFPRLEIDLEGIAANARAVTEACRRPGIDVWGVTKGVVGCPRCARAMLRGGVTGLADSRLPSLGRLRLELGRVPLMLLRSPSPGQAEEVVGLADVSLNSEAETLRALAAASRGRAVSHEVILMVDLGDRREGVLPPDLVPLARVAAAASPLRLTGIGANFACYGGVVPTAESLAELVALAGRVEREAGKTLEVVSGGNSTALKLVYGGGMPAGVSQLRVGEAILLGREPSAGSALPGTRQDAFRLAVEVIELKRKPSAPRGRVVECDAFGRRPVLADRGDRLRALAAVGVADLGAGALQPEEEGIEVLGASSDHLILDVSEATAVAGVGDRLWFSLNYGALLGLMTSPHVHRHYLGGRQVRKGVSP